MITKDTCKELLEKQDGIEEIELYKGQYLRARFANRINPAEPHVLVVDPIENRLALKIRVPEIAQVRSPNSELPRILQDINYRLLIGKVGTDARDGEVMFEINHACQDGGAADPSPEVFARLVGTAIETTHEVHLMATHVGMVEAGVPAEVEQIIGSPRGVNPITTTMTGDLYLSPSGGCLEEAGASGKIVVVDRFGAGTCGYPNRADIMARSGAKAIVFYYNDRNLGGPSAQSLALPAVAVGLRGGKPFMDWLAAGGTGRIEISGTIARAKSDVADVMSSSSSQGPGLDWQIKPDVAAPGEGTMSSVIFIDRSGQRLYRVDAKSGTSMATPHVSGAVGVLRGAHPDWTVDQIRSAIVNTASPSLKVNVLEPRAAMPYDGGPGRLDVAAALDPGAFLAPTTLSFGRVAEGATVSIPFTIESDLDVAATWTAGVTVGGGTGATVAVEPSTLLAVRINSALTRSAPGGMMTAQKRHLMPRQRTLKSQH